MKAILAKGAITLFGNIGYNRLLEHELGIYLNKLRTPVQMNVEQYAVYDETGIYVGDIQSKGVHFYSSELREAILALDVWKPETVEMAIASLQRKLEIQDQNVAIFTAKFEQARKTAGAMRDKLDIALPLVGWWQGDLRKWIRTAIDLADKEIPRDMYDSILENSWDY